MSPKVRRVVRSVKYFFVFIILAAVVLCIVTLLSGESVVKLFMPMSEGGMLKEGAWWQMLLIFGAIAAVYPGLTFVKKEVMIEGDFEDHRNTIINAFEGLGYEKTDEDGEKLTFRPITKGTAPLILSGNRKDILRLSSHITYALREDIGEGAAQQHDDPYDFGSGSSDTADQTENTDKQKTE